MSKLLRPSRARKAEPHNWAVSKTMQTHARGAIKLSRRFGETLVCVRYRISPDGRERMTTVELLIDRVAVQSKVNPSVTVKIYPSEAKLRAQAKARGAWFNPDTRLWRMRQNDAQALGLSDRIARLDNQ
jgi:hypothetical protein